MTRILVNCTHGAEDPERAILPFVVGNVARSADQEAIIFLTVEGVRLATHGYAASVKKDGFQPADELVQSFIASGGELWACAACTKPRGITESDIIPGAKIVTAANLVECLASGASAINVS
ncbi:MAG TPA: DsrE family protein [Dehalococcoidia bacterium]|nr:DsrE family protein [Dehalococcoidia bacterium]